MSKLGALLTGCAAIFGISDSSAASTGRAEMPEIFGCVIYADGWTTQENEIGMYRIPTSADMQFSQLSPTHIDASSGGVMVGGTYWTCYFVDYFGTPFVMVLGYDAQTWEETDFYYATTDMVSTGVTYDPVTRQVYGCFRNDTNTGYVFGTVDYVAKKRTRIADLPRMWSAVAADRNGTIYAIDEQGDLFTVDKTSGAMSLVGHTGLKATNPSSACIDYRSGRLFYALTAAPDGSLYEIDTLTGAPQLVYHFPKNQEIVGMYIPMPQAADKAPDTPSDMNLTFSDGSLSGTLSFTAPATFFDGETGSGSLTCTLEGNGTQLLRSSCTWGDRVSVPVTLPAAGQYEFKLFLSNGAGDSPAVEYETYVGPDTPLAPEFTMTRTGNDVNIRLSAVTTTLHGGYADYKGMRYEVTRLPDNLPLSASADGLTFTDRIPDGGELRSYRYSVRALYGSEKVTASETVLTDKLWTGAATPPYASVFDNFEATEPYTVVNANGDTRTWSWNDENKAFFTTFNRQSDTDDWLITPALDLRKGMVYKVTVALRTYLGNPEEYEIACGRTPSAAGMTRTLRNRTRIKAKEAQEVVVYLTPDEDGAWYLGIHGVTPAAESWYLYVDSIRVEAGVSDDVPGVPDSMEITPDFNGALEATVKIVAPTVSANGNALATIDRLELRRDGQLIKRFDNPRPGETLDWTDKVNTNGYHTYTAVAFNSHGEGRAAERRVFVGINSPGRPAWAHIEETENPGEVKVTWAQVTTAADGTPINPDLVTYELMTVDDTHGGEAYTAAEGISGTEYVLTVPGTDRFQRFAYYAVKAVTATDYSLMTLTPFLPVGPAYELPYAESFSSGRAVTLMRPENGVAMWSIYADDSGIPAHDGDHGMAAMFGELYGADATLYSGKINLKGSTHPVLTFYTYNIAGSDPDLNELRISIGVGTDFKEVRSLVVSDLGESDGWYPVVIPLDEYAGREIQIAFHGVTRNRQFTLIDDIAVSDGTRLNLRAGLLSAPASVAAGEEFDVVATVENTGRENVADSRVLLLLDGEEIASAQSGPVEAGRTVAVKFPQTLNVTSEPSVSYSFVVELDGDEVESDNTSETFTVIVDFANVPSPEDLRGECNEAGVTLEWNEPDLDKLAPPAVTEDFESWSAWNKDGENGWVFVDRDNSGIGAIQNIQFPGIDYNSKLSWFVLDSSADGLSKDYSAASGSKYLSTFFCLPLGDFQYVPNDDWAISPQLYGGSQRITLKARSINPYEAEESFEILYATDDTTDPDRFISLEKVGEVPGVWTTYTFTLPAGARRFAVRYDKTFGFMLHLDDVTFVPAGVSDLELTGYNVYRDGELVTAKPLTARRYSDGFLCDRDVAYSVSAVYSDGSESRACTPVILNLDNSGVAAPDNSSVTVSARHGEITVKGADGKTVTIYDLSGRMVHNRLCGAEEHIRLTPGLYIATIRNRVWKLSL